MLPRRNPFLKIKTQVKSKKVNKKKLLAKKSKGGIRSKCHHILSGGPASQFVDSCLLTVCSHGLPLVCTCVERYLSLPFIRALIPS